MTKFQFKQLTPWQLGITASLIALALFLLLLFGKFGGNVSGFYRIGDRLGFSPLLNPAELIVMEGKAGNDGQQFLTLALDPFQRLPGTSAALDNAHYRGKRLLYPLLAYILGLGQPPLILYSLALINVACLGILVWLLALWRRQGKRTIGALGMLCIPSVWIILSLATSDLLSSTLVVASLLAFGRERFALCALMLSLAVLTRETNILIGAGLGLTGWRMLGLKKVWPLALAPLPLFAWLVYLRLEVPLPVHGLFNKVQLQLPGQALLSKVEQLAGLGRGAESVFDLACLMFLLSAIVLGGLLAWRDSRFTFLRISWLLSVLLFLIVSMQVLDRFPDYTRVFVDLYCFVLFMGVERWRSGRIWLLGGALLSLGYLIGFYFKS